MGRDLAVDLQPLAQALVAGVGRRQALQPCLQLVLLHRAREVGSRIIGLGLEAPVVDERGGRQAAGVHRAGVLERAGDQLRLTALAHLRIVGREQGVQACRRIGLWLQSLSIGVGQGLLEEGGLLGAQGDRRGGAPAGQHLALRRLARGGHHQSAAHRRRAGCSRHNAQTGLQRHDPLARACAPERSGLHLRVHSTGPAPAAWSRPNPQGANAFKLHCDPSEPLRAPLLYHGLRL